MTAPTPSPPPGSANGTAPASVQTAKLLAYVLVAIQAIRTLITIIANDTLVDAYLEDQGVDPGGAGDFARDGAPAYTGIAIISLVLFGLLIAALANQFGQGKSWARIVTVIFTGLGGLVGLITLVQPAPAWFVILGLITAAVSFALIVFLFRPDANGYFKNTP